MRLAHLASAVALAVGFVAPSVPIALADEGLSATILSPAGGSTIRADANVTIAYAGHSAASAQGYLTLDGAWAGSFHAPVSTSNATFTVRLNTTGFAPGTYSLGAHVFSPGDPPVDAAPVTITLDTPPRLSATATYDLDERALRVLAQVEDDGAEAPRVRLTSGSAAWNGSFVGGRELVLPIARKPGTYAAHLSATDALGQNTTLLLSYTVDDRASAIQLHEATYVIPDGLRVTLSATDADGISSMQVNTTLGGFAYFRYNETTQTWTAFVSIDARLGEHTGTIVTRDIHGGATRHDFTFAIGGGRETLFERTITTDTGAYVDAITLSLPRVHEGLLEVCLDGVCSGNDYWIGTQVEALIHDPRGIQPPRVCTAPRVAAPPCAFDTANPSGWNLYIAWQQVGYLEVSVRVTGIRI